MVPKLLDEREAARELGIHAETLARLRRTKKIACCMIAGRVRYREEHLAAYIADNECPAEKNSTASETSGSHKSPARRTGTGPGLTEERAKLAAQRLASTTLRLPKRLLTTGTSNTSDL
jgi:hypothetical protein